MHSSQSTWLPAPQQLILANDEVHVWQAKLDRTVSHVQTFLNTLDQDERIRAQRFRFQRDQNHFIVAHGLLRVILGRYLHEHPHTLRFSYNPYGKPALAEEYSDHTLSFNLSHASGLVLYAITYGRRIGIDLERIEPNFANEQIAEQFFSPRETAMLRSLPPHLRQEAFFNCWTRKEAYLKAIGEGLSASLNQCEVTLIPGEPARLLRSVGNQQDIATWSLQAFTPSPGYMAALAVEGRDWQLRCWQWAEEAV
jgi:4'-phosphopantetheinyl transferase